MPDKTTDKPLFHEYGCTILATIMAAESGLLCEIMNEDGCPLENKNE